MAYADDMVFVIEGLDNLYQIIEKIDKWSFENSMIINHSKSGIFILNAKRKNNMELDNIKKYPIVYKYKYLGVTFTNNFSFQLHIDELKGKMKKITKYSNRINSKLISLPAKIQIFNNYVSSRIFYGMEIAVARSSQLKAIETLYTSNLKKILNLKQSFNNELLLKLTQTKSPLSIMINRFFNLCTSIQAKVRPGNEHIEKLKLSLIEAQRTHHIKPGKPYKELNIFTLKFLGESGLFNLKFSKHPLTCKICGSTSENIDTDIKCFNSISNTNLSLKDLKDTILNHNSTTNDINTTLSTVNNMLITIYDINLESTYLNDSVDESIHHKKS